MSLFVLLELLLWWHTFGWVVLFVVYVQLFRGGSVEAVCVVFSFSGRSGTWVNYEIEMKCGPRESTLEGIFISFLSPFISDVLLFWECLFFEIQVVLLV